MRDTSATPRESVLFQIALPTKGGGRGKRVRKQEVLLHDNPYGGRMSPRFHINTSGDSTFLCTKAGIKIHEGHKRQRLL